VFLFLTFYLQTTLDYSAIRTGFAFLPMVVALSLTSVLVSSKLLPRVGPRPLVPPGLVVAAAGMIIFTRLGAQSGYVTHILPGLLVLGVGLGFAISPSTNTATANVEPDDAGVASAMVSTSQQVGGSIGTSLLSTLAASAVASFVASHPPGPSLAAQAALHSYTVAFWWSAAILAVGAAAGLLLFRSGAVAAAPAAPAASAPSAASGRPTPRRLTIR
jgi:MFS family permease